jgi:hypothetical protein
MIRIARAASLALLAAVASVGAAQAGCLDPMPRIVPALVVQQNQQLTRPDLTVRLSPSLQVYTPAPAPRPVRAQAAAPAARAAVPVRAAPAAAQ